MTTRTRRAPAWVCVMLLTGSAGAALAACGNTLQTPTVTDRLLYPATSEGIFPVYWVGRAFEGMPVTAVTRDQGGPFTITYGTCREGGQYACTTPLALVTAPDNSFLPGHPPDTSHEMIRGRNATVGAGGDALEVATAN